MKKTFTPLLFKVVILIGAFFISTHTNAQLFYQDFNGSAVTPVINGPVTNADYYTATGAANKFDTIHGANHGSSSIEINNSTASNFQTVDAGTGYMWLVARTTNLAATAPTAVKITFSARFDVNSTGTTNPRFIFQMGSGFSKVFSTTNMAMKEANANVFAGFGLKCQSSSAGATLYQNDGSTQIGATNIGETTSTWTIVINNTGSSLTYVDPNGANETVANDTWDLWIGTTKWGNDIAATTGTQTLNNFKFGSFTNGSSGRINNYIDWIRIDDIGCYPPVFSTQPSTSAQTVCQNGSTTALTVAATPQTSYQWYSNTANSNSGGTAISGANSASYTPLSTTAGALYYYCEAINGSATCTTKSNVSGLITVNATSVGGTVGSNAIVCTGTNSGTLTLTGKTGTVDKWQSATVSDFSSYTDIVNTTTSQGYTNIGATTYYRAVVTNGVCPAANSAAATITVTSPPDLSNLSTSVGTGCQGTAFTVTLTSSSLASKTYTVTYDLTGTNTGTGLTASVTMAAGTGSFNTGTLANSGSTTVTITSIAEGSCSSAPAGATGTAAFTVSAFPTITLGTNPTVCYSAGAQTANLPYSATTSSPTTYSISGWSNGSFANVTDAALAAAPSNIGIAVPAGMAAGTYTATLTVKGTCTSANYAISVTVNQVTVTPTSQTVALGATTMSLPVTTGGSPNEYSIDFADVSFTDVSYTTLSGSPITPIAIPGKTTAATYNATITVRNTTTGCASAATAFTVSYASLVTNSFRSKQTGAWSTASNWESSSDLVNWYTASIAPDYQSNGITVLSPHTITITSGTVVADSLKVNSGATLILADGATLTPNNDVAIINDIEIAGTFENQTTANPNFGSTGTFKILDGATYKINGYTGNAQIGFTNVSFNSGVTGGTLYIATGVPRLPFSNTGNVIWNSPSASNSFLNGTGSSTVIGGNFTIINTGAGGINNGSGGSGRTLTVSGDLIVQGGEYYLAGTSGNNIGGNMVTTVTGDLTITGGTVGVYGSTFGYASGNSTLTAKNITVSGGNLYTVTSGVPAASNVSLVIKGNFLHTSGNFGNNATGIAALINFNGTVAQTISTTGLIELGTNNVNITNTDATTGVTLNSDMNINGVFNITSASGGNFRVSNLDRFGAARNNALTISYNGGSPCNIGTGRTFNIDGTLINTGYLGGSLFTKVGTGAVYFNAGSTYKHAVNAGGVPFPTSWDVTSTVWITGSQANPPTSTSFNQTLGNLTWECASQSANLNLLNPSSLVVAGDFTVKNTNGFYVRLGATNAAATIAVTKKLILNGGYFSIASGSVPTTLTVGQDVELTNSSILEVGNATTAAGTSILRLSGNLTAASGTSITNTSAVAAGDSIEFVGAHSPAQVVTVNGATVYTGTRLHYQVKSTSTVQLGTSSNLTIGGMLNIEGAGGIFDINGNTLTLNGNITGTGTISGSSSSNLTVGGTSGGSLGTLYFTSGARSLNNMTINRTGASPSVTLGTDVRSHGTATFTSGTFIINGNTLRINNGSWGTGTLTGSSTSNLTVDGTGGSMKFTGGKTTLKDLLLNTSATAALADSLDITAGSTPGSVTVAASSTLTTNDKLTLKSDVNGTSRVGQSSGAISGKAIVERYLYIGNTAYSRRWHLLTAPFKKDGSAQTINEAWQEGTTTGTRLAPANPHPGYGVLITKSTTNTKATDGFDQGSTGNPSIYALTPGTSSFIVPTDLYTTDITDHEGYMLFVRGDRSIIIGDQYVPANTTNLRAKGNLWVGANVVKGLTTGRNFVGNPYASAIAMDSVQINGTVFSSSGLSYYYWDPKMTPTGTLVGKFITVNDDGIPNTTSYSVTPNQSGLADGTIESGMAINFISAGAPNTMTFHEGDKISTSSNLGLASRPIANRPQSAVPGLYKLYTSLYAAEGPDNYNLSDGVINTFYPTYNNAVDEKDAPKLSSFNQKEDLSLVREGKNLAIEKRLPVNLSDTMFLQTKNLDNKKYQLHFEAQNFDPSLTAFVEDTYTGTKTSINTTTASKTIIDFSVNTGIAASANPNRFRIVFRNPAGATPLPVTISSIKAAQQNKQISVDWKVENELNIKTYEVERSADGINFTKAGTITATGGGMYNWLDQQPLDGNNFYRIRSIGISGEVLYSQIVKVAISKQAPSLTVYPTVMTNGKTALQLTNMPKGRYDIRLINAAGQIMLSQQLTHAGGSATEIIQAGQVVSGGIYQLEIIQPDKTKTTVKLLSQ